MASASARPSRVNRFRRHGDLENQHQRQRSEGQAKQQRLADADDLFHIAVHAEAHDHLMQCYRDDDALEAQRQRRSDEEMRTLLRPGLPAYRHRQQDRLRREYVENGEDAVLIEKRETCNQHQAGKKMRDIVGVIHLSTSRVRKARRMARKAKTKAPPRNSPTRNTRILAMLTSQTPSSMAPIVSFTR